MTEYFGEVFIEDIKNSPETSIPRIIEEIPTLGHELEPKFHKILPQTLELLNNPSLSKLLVKLYSCYILYSNDPDTIVESLVKSSYSSNWKVKLSASSLISLMYKDCFSKISRSLNESLLMALEYLSRDTSSLVSNTAKKVLESFRSEPKTEESTFAFKFNATLGNNASKLSVPVSSVYIDSSNNGLVFNFIEPEIVQEIEDQSNWRARVLAIQKLELAFDSLDSYHHIFQFAAVFVRFLAKLIEDKNFKISEVSLSICSKLVLIHNIASYCNLAALVPPCIAKLGDNKISIRMTSFRVLKELLFKLRPTIIIASLVQGLESPNWHVREEIVALLITAMLSPVTFSYSDLIEPFAKLLDDAKTKIRIVAIEALAVLATKIEIEEQLKHLLDESAFEAVKSRFSNPSLARILEDYIEYPKLSKLHSSPNHYSANVREEIFSARSDIKPSEVSIFSTRPLTEIKETSEISKSQNILPAKLTKFPDFNTKTEAEHLYLSYEELVPVKNPHEALLRAMNRQEDWERQFQTINLLRRLNKHHSEVFFSKVTLHNVVLDLVKWADSLRSSLAKNSLILIKEMCEKLRKSMDSEISEVLKILIRKATDTNVFIMQQAKVTLATFLECLSEQKIMPFVIFHAQNAKKAGIKAQIAFCFGKLFKKVGENIGKIRDIEKSLQVLAEFTSDASCEVRNATKAALEELEKSLKSEFDLLLIRSLKDSEYQKIQKSLEKKTKSASPIKSKSDSKLQRSEFNLRRHFPKFIN